MIEQVCSQDKFTIFGEMARSKAQLQHTECSIDFASLHSSNSKNHVCVSGKHHHMWDRWRLRCGSGCQRLHLHKPLLHHPEYPQALAQQHLQCSVHWRAVSNHRWVHEWMSRAQQSWQSWVTGLQLKLSGFLLTRLRHDHSVGGAQRVRHRTATLPRALPAVLPAQPVPHVAARTRAA